MIGNSPRCTRTPAVAKIAQVPECYSQKRDPTTAERVDEVAPPVTAYFLTSIGLLQLCTITKTVHSTERYCHSTVEVVLDAVFAHTPA